MSYDNKIPYLKKSKQIVTEHYLGKNVINFHKIYYNVQTTN